MPSFQEYIEEIRPIFENHVLTNMGPIYKKFQKQLIEYLGVKYLSLFVNGHMALEMAIDALKLKEEGEKIGGGEVITTPFTFISTTHAIVRNNLKPVFCDIRKSDYTLDPEKIEALITEKTVAETALDVFRDAEQQTITYQGNNVWTVSKKLANVGYVVTKEYIQGLIAKEQVVSSMTVISGVAGEGGIFASSVFAGFNPASAYAFMVFNLFSAPCFGAIGAMRSELGSAKKTMFAVLFQTLIAWAIASLVFGIGILFLG
jgi:hypothetical protein